MVSTRLGRLKGAGRVAAWVVGIGAVAVVVSALSFYIAMKVEMRSTEVSVPDLGGHTSEEATRLAEARSLHVEVVDQRHDPAVGNGRVIQQDPPEGASVRRGRRVRLVLSLGGKVIPIPDLVGHPARQVEIEIRQGGIVPGDEAHVHSRTSPAGVVIAQVPAAGSSAVPGSRVHRLVSDGPATPSWVMPDLTGQSLSSVQTWIDQCGFRRGPVRRIPSPGHAAETVVGQMPLSGYPIRSKGIVELTVAQ
jgi:serine/threonine-protein kinase